MKRVSNAKASARPAEGVAGLTIKQSKTQDGDVLTQISHDDPEQAKKLKFDSVKWKTDKLTFYKNGKEVQVDMEKEVLRVSEFPRIVFESTSIELGVSANQLRVHGNLTIRDKKQPIIVPLTFKRLGDGTYQADGKYNFKQSTFGIKPIQLAGGTIKVKDELESEFQLFLK